MKIRALYAMSLSGVELATQVNETNALSTRLTIFFMSYNKKVFALDVMEPAGEQSQFLDLFA